MKTRDVLCTLLVDDKERVIESQCNSIISTGQDTLYLVIPSEVIIIVKFSTALSLALSVKGGESSELPQCNEVYRFQKVW